LILWRVSAFPDLTGRGGLYASGRWHRVGQPVVYLTESPAGAMLEVLVHLEVDPEDLPENLRLMRIELTDQVCQLAYQPTLPDDWRDRKDVTQQLGAAWLARVDSALMRVPSAIMPHTHNWLLNPRHPQAETLSLVVETLKLDSRLFKGRT